MLTLHDLTFAYDETPVLHDIDLNIDSGEIICLLGASGCGKTTLLRVIAGLETGYAGAITLEGQSLRDVAVHRRGFGLMFQDFALFPHMSVAQNIAFGLRMQGVARKERTKKIEDVLSLVGLSGYAERDVNMLSGGEKQRVALARSLAPQPQLLLLDEPLGSLDAGLRDRLIVDLRRIIKTTGLTAIYVTHDQQEAYAIADRIAVMNDGRIEQLDTPQALYRRPQTAFVARFLGMSNIIDEAGALKLLHPDGIHVDASGDRQGTVRECLFRGSYYEITLALDDAKTLSFTLDAMQDNPPSVGDRLTVRVDEPFVIPLQD